MAVLLEFEYLPISVVLIFLLLASLILIYIRLGVGKSKITMKEKLAVHLPFSVYLGWITIASIADVAATLVSLKSNVLSISPETGAAAVIAAVVIISILILIARKDIAYSLVIIWALIGIAVKQSGNQTIATLTEVSAIMIAIVLIATILVTKLRKK